MSPDTRRTAEDGGSKPGAGTDDRQGTPASSPDLEAALRVGTPTPARAGGRGFQPPASAVWPVVAIALLLVIAWWAAFSLTGILWWGAPDDQGQRLAPPDPPQIQAAEADWISLDLYRRAQPRWQP